MHTHRHRLPRKHHKYNTRPKIKDTLRIIAVTRKLDCCHAARRLVGIGKRCTRSPGHDRKSRTYKKKKGVNIQDSSLPPFIAVSTKKCKEYPRERSRSTLLLSPDGSRSTARATAAAASDRALASSALSARTPAVVVSETCLGSGGVRLPLDLPCDLRVLLAWDVPGNSASSSSWIKKSFWVLEYCDNVEISHNEAIDVRILYIFVEDTVATSSSVLSNLLVKLRDDL